MIVQINDDWRIASDPHCWAVQQRRVRERGKHAGEPYWHTHGYYTLAGALRAVVATRLQLGEECTDVSGLCWRVEELLDEVADACAHWAGTSEEAAG